MPCNDFPTTINGLTSAFPDLRSGLRRERSPAGVELLEGWHVERVEDPMTVSLEGRAEGLYVAVDLRDPLFFGTQHIALLLDDLIDTLVLAAHLPEEFLELHRILNALRRELPYTAGRCLYHEAR